ncbi:MAG: hypothetical protein RLO21_15335 [Nitratireductor sp.]
MTENNTPRLLSRQEAAAYCGVSLSTFHGWVKAGNLPAPLFGSKKWDKKAIDAALDRASGLERSVTETETPYQKWKRESGGGKV